ncbi:helix-turn-helix domain-containing protein [Cohnella sp. GCM10020058]|uniref:helix-turn-helix domain-containing protein n=1 Tax=Cohnella sp. GCM10020058 TaxID=3317330 RepID=UPI00362656DF
MIAPSSHLYEILTLVGGARLDGSGAPEERPALSGSVRRVLVVIRSHDDRWQSGHTYLLPAPSVEASSGADAVELAGIEGFLFQAQPPDAAIGAGEALKVPSDASFVRLCDNVMACLQSNLALELFRANVYFQELVYEIYRAKERASSDPREAVERTKAYMERHYAEEMKIDRLAAMAEVSPSYFMELFKKIVGRSPIDYLTSVRIDAARSLLDRTDAPAHQIAQAVGYKDPFYFSRQFKRLTGLSPSRYASRNALRIASFHYPMTGQMLALQNIPYAAPLDREFSRFYKDKYELQIPVHLRDPSEATNRNYNLEVLQRALPDAIVAGDWLREDDRAELERIAPTLYVPWWENSWREHLSIVARFLGESEQAERWLERYDVRATGIRGMLRERVGERSVMAIHVREGKIYSFGSRNLGTVLYDDLGLRPADPLQTSHAYQPVTAERLLEMNPDLLLAAVNDDAQSRELWADLNDNAEWRALSAMRSSSVYRIQPDPWFEYSAMGHERILKEIVKLISSDRTS